jgi:hypothetical protein
MHTRFIKVLAAFFVAALVFAAGTSPLAAQARTEPARARQAGTALEATSQSIAPALNQNATETRRDFYKVLDQYPPALGRVLRLDPSLMTNAGYLASYPQVAAFFAQYPDVPRNPGFYLERYDGNYSYNTPPDARFESIRMWRNIIEFFGAFTIFCVVTFALFSMVKYIVEYRRWHRISKVNTEVHNKILDRFGSNEELLAYIDSPAGRRFLEATPIAASAMGGVPAVGAPIGRILWTVQLGVILMFLSLGLFLISDNAIEEVRQLLLGLSIVGLCLGLGFIMSAGASYVLSRRLGIVRQANEAPTQSV